jgi:amino acid transporter
MEGNNSLSGRSFREWLLGPPLPTDRLAEERLSVLRGLAALSPDGLSSIAYANQEIFLGLVVAGAIGLPYAGRIALVIVSLLILVAFSYTQTIRAYPAGGGSYSVARENLGSTSGLVAAGALLVGYTLNVAVSVTAGVTALLSAFPVFSAQRTMICLAMLVLITWANLRGVQESGRLMSLPVALFVFCGMLLVVSAGVRAISDGPGLYPASFLSQPGLQNVTKALLLHTFASGCTALTGIEAISNGIPLFKPPESRHANQAMVLMMVLMALLFLGTVGLTQYLAILPEPGESVLSALARRVFGDSPLYYAVQIATLFVLLVAANTSFNGFPRLASILANDGYLPRQLTQLGDRLVFSNGIVLLSSLAGLLILLFHADTHALIPLFAVGVFLAFSLSQAGMVIHWLQARGRLWHVKAALNSLGTVGTALAFAVIVYTRFIEGAWIVALLLVLIVTGFRLTRGHYRELASALSMDGLPPDLGPMQEPRVVVPISSLNRVSLNALRYAQSISSRVTAVYVELDPKRTGPLVEKWRRWGMDVPLEVVPSPYRSVVRPLLGFLDQYDEQQKDGQLATIVIPQFIPAHWWENLLHNQTAWLIKLALLYRRRRYGKVRAIIDVPSYIRHRSN